MCAARVLTRKAKAQVVCFSEWLKEKEHRFGRLHDIHPAIMESLFLWTHEVLLASSGDPDLDEIEGIVSRVFLMEGIVVFQLKACVAAAIEYCALQYGIMNIGLLGKREELVAWLQCVEMYASVDQERVRSAVVILLEELDAQFYRGLEFDEEGFFSRLCSSGIGSCDEEWLGWLVTDSLAYLDTEGFMQCTGI